ncbi:MAG: hypothetical protein NC124_21435 [Clostridium sp.]|nr:hypothetical protein [Clostridium sp.]
MHQMNLQFHATYKEIIFFVNEIAELYDLKIYGIQLFPEFYCNQLSYDIVDNTIQYEEIILSKNELKIFDREKYHNYLTEKRGDLMFSLGEDDGKILGESAMGALSNDEINPLWKKIRRKFTKNLLKGAFVVGRKGKQYYPNHWYSKGAKELYQQGVCIKPIAGNTYYELESKE